MAIMREKNGKFIPYRNAELIPAFLFIPKELLDQADEKLQSLPRTLREFMYDKNTIRIVESDLFLLLMYDVFAHMTWPYMCPGEKREIYSGYHPMWIAAHDFNLWIRALMDLKYLPSAAELFTNCPLDYYHGYPSLSFVEFAMELAVAEGMAKNNLYDVQAIIKEFPCTEDFDSRPSNQKTDFYRKWYHTQTQHPMVSLDEFRDRYAEEHGGQGWDTEDESANFEDNSVGTVFVEQFMETLTEKDRKILQWRLEGYTLEEIAEKLGYANHSGVLKRIRRIGKAFEEYAGVDYGFGGNRII